MEEKVDERLKKIRHPIINGYEIDRGLFSARGCQCKGTCCNGSVTVDMDIVRMAFRRSDDIVSVMDESQVFDAARWFQVSIVDKKPQLITARYQDRCVMQSEKKECAFQRLAVKEGKHPWAYKPKWCWLFPLTIHEGKPPFLTVNYEHMNHTCQMVEISLIETCEKELRYLLGDDGYVELLNCR